MLDTIKVAEGNNDNMSQILIRNKDAHIRYIFVYLITLIILLVIPMHLVVKFKIKLRPEGGTKTHG